MRKYPNIAEFLPSLVLVVVLGLFWQWAVVYFQVPEWILPPPGQIGQALLESLSVLRPHIQATLWESLLGFSGAVILAVVLALVMDSSFWLKKAVYPLLIISQTVPIISVAPLFIIWFGYGTLPKVIVVGLVCFFPVVVSLLDGLASVDEDLISLLRTMGASRWQIMKIVKLPGAMSSFFSGLKIAAVYSIMGAVIGEWLGASRGLGVFMVRAQHSFMLDKVFAAIILITVLSMMLFSLVKTAEGIVMPWRNLQEEQIDTGKGKTTMKKVFFVLTLLAFAVILFSGCAAQEKPAEPAALEKVTVVLDWTPNTNHTGLFVAKDQGYFQEQGLEVEIIQPAESGAAQLVAAGQAEFGVSYQEEITNARAAGIPLKSIAAVIQHNTSGFASLASANIKTPADFAGKKYGGWGSPMEHAMLASLMQKSGGDVSQVEEVNIGSADFLATVGRDVDFTWIFYGWDGIRAEQQQIPLNVIMLRDVDPALDYYTPVLAASEQTLAEKPETVRKFLAAVSQGYGFAAEKPAEAAEILLANAPELDPELVKASQAWLATRYQDDAPAWGVQKLEVWQAYADWMLNAGLLEQTIDPAEAFTNDFLPQE